MNLIKKLFGHNQDRLQPLPPTNEKPQPTLGLADPRHPARSFIDIASRTADQCINLTWAGNSVLLETNSDDASYLVSVIEDVLNVVPDDLDALLAKSGALCCALQYKTAEDVIDHILSLNPSQFDARQRKLHWQKWEHLFHYPPWSTQAKVLHPIMSAQLQQEHTIQIVRDGLQMGIAIVRPAQKSDFPGGLSSDVPSKWIPKLSVTPHGVVIAHYVIIKDDPVNPWRGESFLPTFLPENVSPTTGYWLLQRLAQLRSCFIVLTDGRDVLYNIRFIFPANLTDTLQSIARLIINQPARSDMTNFQRASQWHMDNFDIQSVW
ncbi:MAG: hypothetical protein KF770_05330 [Anaerolineae bacterium]|nr:hypothetical protein [Anaerolineae bacterium]